MYLASVPSTPSVWGDSDVWTSGFDVQAHREGGAEGNTSLLPPYLPRPPELMEVGGSGCGYQCKVGKKKKKLLAQLTRAQAEEESHKDNLDKIAVKLRGTTSNKDIGVVLA